MKICSKCNERKSFTDFYVKDSKANRLHAQCKLCYKEHRKTYYIQHYEKNQESYRKRAIKFRTKVKDEYRNNLQKFLEDKFCVDCGETDKVVFELDHIDPKLKSFSISQAVRLGHRWDKVLEELQKCQVLCANCHKRRTAKQYGWYKA